MLIWVVIVIIVINIIDWSSSWSKWQQLTRLLIRFLVLQSMLMWFVGGHYNASNSVFWMMFLIIKLCQSQPWWWWWQTPVVSNNFGPAHSSDEEKVKPSLPMAGFAPKKINQDFNLTATFHPFHKTEIYFVTLFRNIFLILYSSLKCWGTWLICVKAFQATHTLFARQHIAPPSPSTVSHSLIVDLIFHHYRQPIDHLVL